MFTFAKLNWLAEDYGNTAGQSALLERVKELAFQLKQLSSELGKQENKLVLNCGEGVGRVGRTKGMTDRKATMLLR